MTNEMKYHKSETDFKRFKNYDLILTEKDTLKDEVNKILKIIKKLRLKYLLQVTSLLIFYLTISSNRHLRHKTIHHNKMTRASQHNKYVENLM